MGLKQTDIKHARNKQKQQTKFDQLLQRHLYHLGDDLWPGFNILDKADPATSWESKWVVALTADDWNIRVGESSGQSNACWAPQGEEL